MPDILPAA